MPNLALLTVLRAGVVPLALVAHLWMLDAPGWEPPELPEPAAGTVTVAESGDGHSDTLSGCPTGMSACQVPMPTQTPEALLAPALLLAVTVAVITCRAAPVDTASVDAPSERAPPRRAAVPSSVVLLV